VKVRYFFLLLLLGMSSAWAKDGGSPAADRGVGGEEARLTAGSIAGRCARAVSLLASANDMTGQGEGVAWAQATASLAVAREKGFFGDMAPTDMEMVFVRAAFQSLQYTRERPYRDAVMLQASALCALNSRALSGSSK